jgi:hypothetical protein
MRVGDLVMTRRTIYGSGGRIPGGVYCEVEQATFVDGLWLYAVRWSGRAIYVEGSALVAVGTVR